jgi:hypothetical protein
MSWSVTQSGKAGALKVALVTQFDIAKRGCAHMPHEQEMVALIEQLVIKQLDWLDPSTVVTVTGNGSAYQSNGSPPNNRGASFSLAFTPIYGFVE